MEKSIQRMIFHIPMRINRERASASSIRPVKMIEAFERLGYEVILIEGNASQRKKRIKEIKHNIRKGVTYDFLYSESSTMPTLLTEKHHCPTHPFLDFSFFSFCRKHGIKIGLFYRDIYWKFELYGSSIKKNIAKYFYRYDLLKYKQLVDVLYLPSTKMLDYIPIKLNMPVFALPSGLNVDFLQENLTHKDKKLSLLYVGGIGGVYDLKQFVKAVGNIPEVHLTICCRKDDWEREKTQYGILPLNVRIVHGTKEEVKKMFSQTDLFCILINPVEYLNFAVPYKLFESLGYGCPLLGTNHTMTGDFISEKKIGYTCNYTAKDIEKQLLFILDNKTDLVLLREQVKQIALEHTWEKRCLTVIESLHS